MKKLISAFLISLFAMTFNANAIQKIPANQVNGFSGLVSGNGTNLIFGSGVVLSSNIASRAITSNKFSATFWAGIEYLFHTNVIEIGTLTNGLTFYMPADSDFNDHSTNTYTVTPLNTPVAGAGKVNGGVDLQVSAGSYFTIASLGPMVDGMDNFTVAWWYKRTTIGGQSYEVVWGYDSNGANHFYHHVNSKYAQAVLGTQNGLTTTNNSIDYAVGDWNHLVFTFVKNGTSRLYRNGVQLLPTGSYSANTTFGASPFVIGQLVGQPAFGLNGILDEFAVWDRELTPTEVFNLYNYGDGLSLGL